MPLVTLSFEANNNNNNNNQHFFYEDYMIRPQAYLPTWSSWGLVELFTKLYDKNYFKNIWNHLKPLNSSPVKKPLHIGWLKSGGAFCFSNVHWQFVPDSTSCKLNTISKNIEMVTCRQIQLRIIYISRLSLADVRYKLYLYLEQCLCFSVKPGHCGHMAY